MTFGDRLAAAMDARGPLCVGIDPHAGVLADWGLGDDAEGARSFGLRIVDAAAGAAGVVKPQVAFFERHGAAGFAALAEVIDAARAAGLLVIADGKRGDIGSTVDAYGEAWLGGSGAAAPAAFDADAATLTAWTGPAALDGVLDRAAAAERGAFLLAATSNREGRALQTAVVAEGPDAGRTVAAAVVAAAARRNAAEMATAGSAEHLGSAGGLGSTSVLGSTGVVIGATVRLADYGIDPAELAATPVLAPGFGHQGARIEELPEIFGSAAGNVLVASSRALTADGPGGVAAAISAASGEARRWRS